MLQYSVAENLILGQQYFEQYANNGIWLKPLKIVEHANDLRKKFDIRCASVSMKVSNLSGGNQQKLVIAREAYPNPDVFIAIQPTRGLDVGASEFVQETLIALRDQGKGVLLFSLELDEILAVSDGIAVIFDGRIVDIVDAAKTTRQELGRMMLGAHKEKVLITSEGNKQ